MTRFYIFVIRLMLGAICAVVLTRFFHPRASIPSVMGLAVILVGLAYVLEYYRRRKKGP
ncbi:MAG: hypothetical protein IMF18_00815 [Proteobacteria bacterium]|nr:hypothetical protein [Pseudomonadota bacterium]MBN1842338.1 hypothetical protein [Deltaproteobacteria bacterium]